SLSDRSSGGDPTLRPVPGVTDIHLVDVERRQGHTPLEELFTRALEQGRREEAKAIITDVLAGAKNIEVGSDRGTPRLYVVYDDRSVPAAVAGDGVRAL